jgi:ABC-2 type transport system ATP-binding protein
MSVKVEQLTKTYGVQNAVNHISFEVGKGEILGFLGPNGAGKTTTMKILTCFIPQTSGSASVCGFDVSTSPIEVRKRIGYLPEHNPLYKQMYVREYLNFVAGVHKVANAAKRVDEMIERTGLTPERKKVIGALSKGYRQRVGLAQAMLHDPEVLILDEPTTGLDPNQIVDIRNLIKELGKEKTVIFSTHIMQEVQALCDRVIIINKGDIVADDSIDNLQERLSGEPNIIVEFLGTVNVNSLKKINGIKTVTALGANRYALQAAKGEDIRADIFRFAVSNNLVIVEMQREVTTIENVFRTLTH